MNLRETYKQLSKAEQLLIQETHGHVFECECNLCCLHGLVQEALRGVDGAGKSLRKLAGYLEDGELPW